MPDLSTAERDSNRIIETQLDDRAATLEEAAEADVMSYLGPMYPPGDDVVKDVIEATKKGRGRRPRLMVLLETGGGLITVAERIARIFRHHYRRVDFVVPTYAMSAGTVLVMSGDSIYMDYASTLGPIDPQVRARERYVPALGYLEQYQRMIEKSAKGGLTTAELAYFVQNFDAAELYQYEQERELSIALLEEWLVKYKFKNWKVTDKQKFKVTRAMRKARAVQVAERLNDTKRWHSHGRGIPMEMLRRDLNLLVDDFETDPKLARPVHDYFRLLQDYQGRRSHFLYVIHRKGLHVGL